MHNLLSLLATIRLIIVSLFPESIHRLAPDKLNDGTSNHFIIYYLIIAEKKIPPRFHDLDISRIQSEAVRIFFPDTFALAAPFLLFRLKRRGFSSSKVVVQNGGLLLTATR